MAKERLTETTDPEIAELITSAHKDAKQAIVELRDLVRGIHPSVLTDRGLDAAISALAGRCTVPVDVKYEIHERLPLSVEAAAYFVVAESLTNISKHSQATHADLHLSKERNRIVIEVTDDGIGGAHDDTEGGLRGLRDRVRSIEGDMTISSPVGGPTRILVNLPCE
jgi:signal transduction histidine kinase